MRHSSLFRALCSVLSFIILSTAATGVAAQELGQPADGAVEEFVIPAGSKPGDGLEPLEATPSPSGSQSEPVSLDSYPPLLGDDLGEVAATGNEIQPELTTEHVEDRTVASDVWETDDGGMVMRLFDDLKYFEADDGGFVAVDLTLVPIEDREGWFETAANGFSVRFGPMSSDGPVEITTADGQEITLLPTIPEGRIKGIEMDVDLSAGVVTYVEVLPGVDLRYTATATGVKEDVVLKRPGTAARFETIVLGADLDGSVEAETGLFLPAEGKKDTDRVAGGAIPGGLAVGAFVVEDSKGVPVDEKEAGAGIVVQKPDTGRDASGKTRSSVMVEVSKEWLAKQTKESFPIIIDPGYFAAWAVGTNGGGNGSRYPGSAYDMNGIRVGNSMSNGGQHWRAQVRFVDSWDGTTTFGDLAADGWGVTSAQLNLSFELGDATQRYVFAGWSDAGTTSASTGWNQMYPGQYASSADKALVGGSTGGNTGGPVNDWKVPVTNVVRKWLNEEVTDAPYISLKGDEALNLYSYKRFSQAAIHIYLEKKPGRPVPLSPVDDAVIVDTTPTLTATAGAPGYTNQPIVHWFRISTSPNVDDGNIVADSGWVTGTPSWTVPDGLLKDGVQYYWNVKSFDTNYGIYHNTLPSNYLSFTVNKRLGTGDATQPYESFGPGNVNLANGNYSVSVGSAGFSSLGGTVGASLTYNTQADTRYGLTGTYYLDYNQNGLADNGELPIMTRVENPLFDWGLSNPSVGHGAADWFVTHWDGFLQMPYDGVYEFAGIYDDGAKIIVDGTTVINELDTIRSGWHFGSPTVSLDAGDPVPIHIEYREKTGTAGFRISVRCVSGDCYGKYANKPDNWHTHIQDKWMTPSPVSLPTGWTLGTSTGGGRGWVSAETAGSNVVLKDASGSSVTFEYESEGSWEPPEGNFSTLTKPDGAGYVLHSDDGFTYVFGADGQLLKTSSPLDAANPTTTVQEYSNGRLSVLKDPVSNREVTFRYHGSDTCPVHTSLTSAPSGMLCQIRYPDTVGDDTATNIWYTGDLISEIRNPGDERYSFGWTDGVLTSLIDPLVNDAFRYNVAGISLSDADWEIIYVDGKVTQVTSPKPSETGDRAVGKIVYGSQSATLQTKGLSVANQFGSTRTVYWDSDLRSYRITGADGTEVSQVWNPNDTLKSSKDTAGRLTTYHYDADFDRLTDTYGPAPASCFDTTTLLPNDSCMSPAVAHAQTAYDENLSGLAVSLFGNPDLASTPTSFGRNTDSRIAASDAFVPSGTNWSARHQGMFYTAGGASNDTITAWFRGGMRVYVDNVLVIDKWDDDLAWVPQDSGQLTLTSGWHDIRIDFKPNSSNSDHFVVKLGASPGAGSALSGGDLAAMYNLPTSNTVFDDDGVTPTIINETTYAKPWLGLASQTSVDPLGLNLETSASHEVTYNRRTSRNMPDGATWTYQWYGPTEAPVSNSCSGVAAQQAGMAKNRYYESSTNRPDFYVYDNMGRQIGSRVGSSGAWTCTTLDNQGRTLQVSHPDNRTTYYDYAPENNPLFHHIGETIGTADQGTILNGYDLLGREVLYYDSLGVITQTAYDQAGRVTSSTTTKAGSSIVNGITYDSFGRVDTQTINGVTAASTSYNLDGEVLSYSYIHGANTTTATISRDDRQGSIIGVVYALNGTTLDESVVRSQTGRIKTHMTDGSEWNYVYDGVGRLRSAVRGTDSYSYNFDDNSNRSSANLDGTGVSYTYDSLDRLTSFTGMSGSIAYDSHGNTTSLDGLTLGWDGSDRNTSISKTGMSVTYDRDMTDRIRERTENGVATRYYFDGAGDSPIAISAPNSVSVLEWYVTLPGGVMRTVKVGAADSWLYPNLHGDTLVTVNAAGQKVSGPFVYGPYGEQIGGSHADVTGVSADYGWVGEHQKATETGLDNIMQMGARPYHPGLGRFLAVDPVEGGTPNDYVYVTDPINSFDLNGMWGLPNPIKAIKKAAVAVTSTVASVGRSAWSNRRRVAKYAIVAAGVAGGAACIASVVCGLAAASAIGAASAGGAYLAEKAGTDEFSWKGLAITTVVGGVLGRVGATGARSANLGRAGLAAAANRTRRLYANRSIGVLSHWRIEARITRSWFSAAARATYGRSQELVSYGGNAYCVRTGRC